MVHREQQIHNIVYNDDNIVNLIKSAPQTYNSILQEFKCNDTWQTVLRRRVRKLVKKQSLWKLSVPGTRFGLAIFCTPVHDYKIIVSQGLYKVRIFYLYKFRENGTHILLDNYWELVGDGWSKWQYCDTMLQIPKCALRDGVIRLWG